jgi:hypothetical protein
MTGWWMVVFWFLLVPLIIVEIIVYLKSKKFFWLIYALAIFTYVVAVCYTVDVFDLGKNAIILILLASAVLMFLVGRQLGKGMKRLKRVARPTAYVLVIIAVVLVAVFTLSVVFGRLAVSATPVSSIAADKILVNNPKAEGPYPANGVTIFTETYTNSFVMPVPVKPEYYRVCLIMKSGSVQLSRSYTVEDRFTEIAPGETRAIEYKVEPNQVYDPNTTLVPQQVLVYTTTQEKQWESCDTNAGSPLYTIPVI